MNNRGLALWQAILAAGSFMTAGGQLNGFVSTRVAGFLGLLMGSLQAGTVVYLAAIKYTEPPKTGDRVIGVIKQGP
jgi:hypothetical protein